MVMLEELHEAGQTIILVTHEDYIAEHALRTIKLKDGLIESDVSHGKIRHAAITTESANRVTL
jgi:putative ABC transport system ATP-binding protein